jgi:hypothetical protein
MAEQTAAARANSKTITQWSAHLKTCISASRRFCITALYDDIDPPNHLVRLQ